MPISPVRARVITVMKLPSITAKRMDLMLRLGNMLAALVKTANRMDMPIHISMNSKGEMCRSFFSVGRSSPLTSRDLGRFLRSCINFSLIILFA